MCMPSVPQAVIATISTKGARCPAAERRRSVPLHAACFLSGRFDGDAKHGCKSAASHRAREGAGAWRRPSPRSPCSASASVRSAPLLSLLLEQRGTDVTLNGLNAGATFIGVIVGPLLAPRLVRRFGIRNFLLVCFGLDIALFLAMKALDSLAAWFVLRRAGRRRRVEHLHDRRGLDQSAGRRRGPRPDHRDLRGGAVGRLRHRPADPVAHRHRWMAAVPGQRRHRRAGDAAAVRRRRRLARLRPGTRRRSAAHVRPRAGRSSAPSRCSACTSRR